MVNVKEMNNDQLKNLASEIRQKILLATSQNGGHLSSNLGVVELTIALHKAFDFPNDTLIFDVGHQCYTHKLLTGREKLVQNLRRKGGISGFMDPSESPYDAFSTGHSSTAVSLAIGKCIQNQMNGIKSEIVAVVGDASATNGLTLEALNFLGAHPELKVIVIINDNDMSISPNVGGLAKTFNKIRIKRNKAFIFKITPRFMHRFLERMKNGFKDTIYNKSLFDNFNLKYIPGIDGHNFKELAKYLAFAKKYPSSVVLHVKTIKGKGYEPAENDKTGIWHSVDHFNIEQGVFDFEREPYVGEVLGETLSELVEAKKIKVITSAMILGCGLNEFATKHPEHLIDVGIAEENAVAISAGMAGSGVVPVVFIYSTFLQRAYDQIVNDLVRVNKHVVFCVDRAGLVPADGSTHHGIFDLAMFLPLPNVTVFAPSTLEEARTLLKRSIDMEGVVVIRYPRMLPSHEQVNQKYFEIYKEVADRTVLAYGGDVYNLCDELDDDIGLINVIKLKPVDEELIKTIQNCKEIFVYEQAVHTVCFATILQQELLKWGLKIKVRSLSLNDFDPLDASVVTEGLEIPDELLKK